MAELTRMTLKVVCPTPTCHESYIVTYRVGDEKCVIVCPKCNSGYIQDVLDFDLELDGYIKDEDDE